MFKKNRPKPTAPIGLSSESYDNNSSKPQNGQNKPTAPQIPTNKSILQFHCQLAHGSPTVFVSGFANVKELYQKIAESFDISSSEILYCTLNTYKPDMKKLLGGQIGLEDFIFAHKKGTTKEVELIKTEEALGLTITDNGAGYAFIKRIKEGSIIDSIPHIHVGDHIEKLDGENMIGKRHYEVARSLKEIPVGSTFTIRLVETMKSGFNGIGPKGGSSKPSKKPIMSGKGTLRFKAGGPIVVEDEDDSMEVGIEKINTILESFMGINDSELATQIWDLADKKSNSMDFADAIDDSDLSSFEFTDELIIELWGAITDARDGR